MSRHNRNPFYHGYVYSCGDLDCKFERSAATGYWIIRISSPEENRQLYSTPPTESKLDAYAMAREWCSLYVSSLRICESPNPVECE